MKYQAPGYNYPRIITTVVLALLIGITIIAFGQAGYRLKGWKLVKAGAIAIELPVEDAAAFLGEERTLILGTKGTLGNLTPGTYELIIAKDGYWPWKKTLKVLSKETLTVRPLMVSANPTGVAIPQDDPEYATLMAGFATRSVPGPTTQAKKGAVSLWASGTTIFVEEGGKTTAIFESATDIRSLDFYKDRTDAVIFATGVGIYAIEVDNTSMQNFQPIYTGGEPFFYKKDEASLYVKDGKALMIVNF